MTTNAILSQGSKIQVEDPGTPGTYLDIPECYSASGPTSANPEVDVTSCEDNARVYKAGLPDNGTLSFNVHFIPDNTVHAILSSDMRSNPAPERNWQIVFTDTAGTIWRFPGHVQQLQIDLGLDQPTNASLQIRIVGAIEENPA